MDWIERGLASDGPVRVISAPADQIFKDITPALAAKLPTYQGELELVQHSDGALSSEAYMKRWNRKNEQLAQAAEGAATAASWLGVFPYPYDALYRGWDLVLGSQMHDILPGTSVPKAYEYSWNDEVLALNQFATVTERATAARALHARYARAGNARSRCTTRSPSNARIRWKRRSHSSVRRPQSITAYDPQGQPVPTQILDQQGSVAPRPFPRASAIGRLSPSTICGPTPARRPAPRWRSARTRWKTPVIGSRSTPLATSRRSSTSRSNRRCFPRPARLSIHTENSFDYPAWNMNWDDRQLPVRGYVMDRPGSGSSSTAPPAWR